MDRPLHVRIENADASYYREFYSFPEQRADSTVVKLPFGNPSVNGGSLKSIVHRYDRSGALKELTVYPDLSQPSTARTSAYSYDISGRLTSVARSEGTPHTYAEYLYDGTGAVKQMRLGVDPSTGDEIQAVDYTYDGLGRLVKINDPSGVVAATNTVGAANDHFGQEIVYYDPVEEEGYFNGRVYKAGCASSSGGALPNTYAYQFEYNDLAWLTKAHDGGQATYPNSRRYYYNKMGQRVIREQADSPSETINYHYYTNTPGSSRLRELNDVPSFLEMKYDTLGNLVKDGSRKLDTLTYDYRNLLDYVFMGSPVYPLYHDILRFQYNESGMRIKKMYNYWRTKQYPEGPCPIVTDSTMDGSGGPLGGGQMMAYIPEDPDPDPGGPIYCQTTWRTEKLYLYDGGVLLATFNYYDAVIDLHVNGPTGRLATYYQNDDNKLYYYVNDHLGSPRVVVDNTGQTQYYAYYPFGELIESSGSHGTEFQFTAKERDEHGNFELDYFGARYYDPRVGSFTTIDKASQFASGYIYGANNPVSLVDPDGNFVPELLHFIQVAGYMMAGTQIALAVVRGQYDMAILSSMSMFVGIPNPYKGTNLVYSVASDGLTSAVNNAMWNGVTGRRFDEGVLGSMASGATMGFLRSEHMANFEGMGEFRSTESILRKYDLLGGPQSAGRGPHAPGHPTTDAVKQQEILHKLMAIWGTKYVSHRVTKKDQGSTGIYQRLHIRRDDWMEASGQNSAFPTLGLGQAAGVVYKYDVENYDVRAILYMDEYMLNVDANAVGAPQRGRVQIQFAVPDLRLKEVSLGRAPHPIGVFVGPGAIDYAKPILDLMPDDLGLLGWLPHWNTYTTIKNRINVMLRQSPGLQIGSGSYPGDYIREF